METPGTFNEGQGKCVGRTAHGVFVYVNTKGWPEPYKFIKCMYGVYIRYVYTDRILYKLLFKLFTAWCFDGFRFYRVHSTYCTFPLSPVKTSFLPSGMMPALFIIYLF